MRQILFIGLLLMMLSALLGACGSAPTSAPEGSGKPVNIKVETNPNPAVMGDLELVLNITDESGNPIEGATVDVSATHIDMSGMDMSGAATEQGGGQYAINANFGMSGNWELKVYVRKEGLDYSEEITLPIQ